MVVYRVEHHRTELGPYTHGVCSFDRHYCNDEYCPAPDEDGIDKWCFHNAHYGFKSKKDLVRWFSREYIRQFAYSGLYVYMFRVPDEDVSKGRRHLAFETGYAVRVRRVSMCELL